MPNKKVMVILLYALLVVFTVLTTAAPLLATDKENVLLTFFGGRYGGVPFATLIFDDAGNLYGTTLGGGAFGYGAVFRLARDTNGRWVETVLYSFNGKDGANPSAGLVFDASGNLYGTTANGGNSTNCNGGCGTVFVLIPRMDGRWGHKVLHTFADHGGGNPLSPLIFDHMGNLYGTTLNGGRYSGGTAFRLSPGSDGKWTKTVLHAFNRDDGIAPWAPLVFDQAGNLYGTTSLLGGVGNDAGTVFELSPDIGGKWTLKVLHRFDIVKECGESESGLTFDTEGNLYGLAYNTAGPLYGCAFELTRRTGGKWTFTILHEFTWGNDGAYPVGNLIFDAQGNLYGVTNDGGGGTSSGTVFELSPGSNGKRWNETILHSFNTPDGISPQAGLILDAAGTLYGTTSFGGPLGGDGVVFSITH